jgi:hypothetical protein
LASTTDPVSLIIEPPLAVSKKSPLLSEVIVGDPERLSPFESTFLIWKYCALRVPPEIENAYVPVPVLEIVVVAKDPPTISSEPPEYAIEELVAICTLACRGEPSTVPSKSVA